jgi:hypothetical protein
MWADDTDYEGLNAEADDSSEATEPDTDDRAWEQAALGSDGPSWAQVVAGDSKRGGRDALCSAAERPDSGPGAAATHRTAGEAGDPVGIRAVQSILMSATQMNLSHFHTAGMGTGSGAEARPSAAEAMDSVYTAANTGMRFRASSSIWGVRKQIVGADLGSFVVTIGSSFTSVPDYENVWYRVRGDPMLDNGFLRLYIDYNKMHNHGLTLQELAQEAFGDDYKWMVSPDFMGMIDVQAAEWRGMSSLLSKMGCMVCGTPNIVSCDVSGDGATFVTRGTDILAVSRVLNVVKESMVCNNIAEVEMAFGIEAAASMLNKLVGSRIVSDFMARTGRLLPFNKRSAEVQARGLLTSMGFERPKEDIRKAVVRGANVYNRGGVHVYEAIMTGVDPPQNFDIRPC